MFSFNQITFAENLPFKHVAKSYQSHGKVVCCPLPRFQLVAHKAPHFLPDVKPRTVSGTPFSAVRTYPVGADYGKIFPDIMKHTLQFHMILYG